MTSKTISPNTLTSSGKLDSVADADGNSRLPSYIPMYVLNLGSYTNGQACAAASKRGGTSRPAIRGRFPAQKREFHAAPPTARPARWNSAQPRRQDRKSVV